jgi:hypothetical protein
MGSNHDGAVALADKFATFDAAFAPRRWPTSTTSS